MKCHPFSCWKKSLRGKSGKWSYTNKLTAGSEPILFTGEMIFSWMRSDYKALQPLGEAAEILAACDDWPKLYNPENLKKSAAKCAALMSYDDIYVERDYSEATAAMLSNCRTWVSNEFQHSAVKDDGERVFERLLAMTKGEIEY